MRESVARNHTLALHPDCRDPDHPGCSDCDGSREDAIDELGIKFFAAARTSDINQPAKFAPLCVDFADPNYFSSHGLNKPKRLQTIAEVMIDSLDASGGPTLEDVLQLLSNAALGAPIRSEANTLISRMACQWAQDNTPK